MTSAISLLKLDKRALAYIKTEMRRNLFFLIFAPCATVIITALLICGFVSFAFDSGSITENLISEINFIIGCFNLFVAAAMASFSFRFLYNRRKVDFFGALPINRSTQYFAKSITGIVALLLSFAAEYAVCEAVVFLSKKLFAQNAYFKRGEVAAAFLVTALAVVAMYLLFNFLAASSGKVWHYILLCALSVPAQLGISHLFVIPSDYIAGLGVKAESFKSVFVPLSAFCFVPSKYSVGYGAVIIGMIIMSVLIYLLGVWQYNKHKNENSQFSLSGRIAAGIMIFAVPINFFSTLFAPEKFYISAAIGIPSALVAVIILSLIFYKKPIIKPFMIEFGAVCALCTVLLAFSATGAFGWSGRLPDTNRIETVKVTVTGKQLPDKTSDRFEYYEDIVEDKKFEFSKAESFEQVEKINQILNKRFNSNEPANNTLSVCFEYTLKNGSVIKRTVNECEYNEENETSINMLAAIKESRERKINEIDFSNKVPVIDFGNDYLNSKEAVADHDMLQDIFEEYVALEYEDALAAMKDDADNMQVQISYLRSDYERFYTNGPKIVKYGASSSWKSLNSEYYDDVTTTGRTILISLPASCEKTLKHFMTLKGIPEFVSLEDADISQIAYAKVAKVAKSDDTDDTEIINFDDYYYASVESEKLLGKYSLNTDLDEYFELADISKHSNDVVLKRIVEDIDTKDIRMKGDKGNAVYFILKDGSRTPVYYSRYSSTGFVFEEITESELW